MEQQRDDTMNAFAIAWTQVNNWLLSRESPIDEDRPIALSLIIEVKRGVHSHI